MNELSNDKTEPKAIITNEPANKSLRVNKLNEPQRRKITLLSSYKPKMKINGFTIEKIYFYNEKKRFIILKTEEDNDIHVFGGNLTKIEHLLVECKYLTTSIKLPKTREMFDYQRAVAINSYLRGETEISNNILQALLKKLQQRKILAKKLWYIGIFLFVVILMVFFSTHNDDFRYIKYFKIATFGAIGGFISLNIKLDKIKFEISDSTLSYLIVSIYKVVFSMLSSIISYFLIESDLILGGISNSNNQYFIYAIATLAGFSESLLPSIFNSIESSTKREEEKEKEKEEEIS